MGSTGEFKSLQDLVGMIQATAERFCCLPFICGSKLVWQHVDGRRSLSENGHALLIPLAHCVAVNTVEGGIIQPVCWYWWILS